MIGGRGRFLALLAVLGGMAGQVVLSDALRDWRLDEGAVPRVPPPALLMTEGLGDKQALFRLLALQAQNFGDGDGRFAPLKNYDYTQLRQWFGVLDGLDPQSGMTLALAGGLYGQSADPGQAKAMADYLRQRGMADPGRCWWWLATAVYIARHRAHDPALAMRIALDLAAVNDPAIPAWAHQLPRFVLSDLSPGAAAQQLSEAIAASLPRLSDDDRRTLDRLARPPGGQGVTP